MKRVAARGNECAGCVQTQHSSGTWLDVPVSDSYSQVAGLWVNCMRELAVEDVFLATGCEMIMRSPRVAIASLGEEASRPETCHVFARHHSKSNKAYLTDVFIFNAASGHLIEMMLGIQYTRFTKASLSRALTRLTGDPSCLRARSDTVAAEERFGTISEQRQVEATPARGISRSTLINDSDQKPSRQDLRQDLKNLIANFCDVEAGEIQDSSEMADLGIDSLMGMELSREVENMLKCKLDQMDLMEATSFREFVVCTARALYGADYQLDEVASADINASSQNGGDVFSEESGEASTVPTTTNVSPPSTPPGDEQLHVVNAVAGTILDMNTSSNLQIRSPDVLTAFGEVKWSTDKRLRDFKVDDTDATIVARSNRLCATLVVEAFEQLGCSLRTASAGQVLLRIPHQPHLARLVDWLYSFLSNDARLIDLDGEHIVRTSISTPRKSSEALYHELLQTNDTWLVAHKLAYMAGTQLVDVIRGTRDGISLLFGSADGRDLVQGLYCDLPYNRLAYEQMRDVIGHLAARLSYAQGPLKILEMGAGTGGTTHILAPFLADLDVPVEYTFTDLSPSMVAQARRKFKMYRFMHFTVHDIEKIPAAELRGQHIVLASNAVHATHDLRVSASNIRKALREDGFLMLTEMTEKLPFIDLVFGLLEGWWLFDDGRQHALVSERKWRAELQAAGFGHVDWTDGELPENNIQRVIIALASSQTWEKLPKRDLLLSEDRNAAQDKAAHETEAENYVARYTAGFDGHTVRSPSPVSDDMGLQDSQSCVVVSGGTGSLGAHLVASFAMRPDIAVVVCLNRRRSNTSPENSQQEALTSRGIILSSAAKEKLVILETDTAKPDLGLPQERYSFLVNNVTHIVHNAWPMSGTRPLRAFEPQFAMLRHLVDLAVAAATATAHHSRVKRVTFQLISSIGVVGQHPVDASDSMVPETRVPITSVLPIGYCEAKWTCERILDETLHRYPEYFRPMVVRPGQIAGCRTSGYWNPVEHFASLVKSAQALRVFPALKGRLQ